MCCRFYIATFPSSGIQRKSGQTVGALRYSESKLDKVSDTDSTTIAVTSTRILQLSQWLRHGFYNYRSDFLRRGNHSFVSRTTS